ncbi:helix-turn-helix domain-containing protein [Bacillus ginsengihumi]|uniref:Helix-turn-helix domain-containing protein n=1 Tax=Heyndrickxia ginsengihumi TaxID=363870 RepID=A0A0A6VGB6_9BACI|nr:transcriptional regulator [Heyndrickxia ginsengihumi]KHD85664.1 transcriptional regulator [Heyndrickxia ginsengihumi]NEY20527.1 helix-turn-helix domain-containing protein [Heyndrickxia ginsengihumi]
MKLGEELAEARKRNGLTQEQLAEQLPISRESLAKYETGKRSYPEDMRPIIANAVDDPEFFFDNWENATGYVSIPYFDGEHIDQHPSSMVFLVKLETDEALEKLKQIHWHKSIHTRSEREKEEIKQLLFELLDAAASMINLVAVICREHKFSMKKIFTQWRLSLRSRKYINRDI